MNSTAKNVVRLGGVAVGIAAAAWALRHRLLPEPEVNTDPPPKFREPRSDAPEDITDVKGIGPATAAKLADAGIDTISELAEADADALAASIGNSASTTAKWIDAAAQHG
ncbi:MAG: helix-hairpin-helix domain-containing protein [Acidimicrobiia bacterium]